MILPPVVRLFVSKHWFYISRPLISASSDNLICEKMSKNQIVLLSVWNLETISCLTVIRTLLNNSANTEDDGVQELTLNYTAKSIEQLELPDHLKRKMLLKIMNIASKCLSQ